MIYIIGSLRNPRIPTIARELRAAGIDVFADWFSAGPEADDSWQAFSRQQGQTFAEALESAHAVNVFDFDKRHLDASHAAVLVAPAGKSAHLELGYMIGRGKPGYILLDGEPERYDVMARFATGVFTSLFDLTEELCRISSLKTAASLYTATATPSRPVS